MNLLWSDIETRFEPETAWNFYYSKLEEILTEKEFEKFIESRVSDNPFLSRPMAQIDFEEIRHWLNDYKNEDLTLAELRGKFNC